MTQKDDLITALAKFKDMTASNQELIDDLGFPPASVRRLTGTLTRMEILTRIEKGVYQLNQMFRHFISAVFYCQDKKTVYSATTYKTDEKNIFSELVTELIVETTADCGDPRVEDNIKELAETETDFGYAVDEVEGVDIDPNFIYPDIEVVEE